MARYIRSFLFIPGHLPEWALKAEKYGADALILDLEDAVPLDRKAEAREAAASVVAQMDGARHAVFVRVNGWHMGLTVADAEAVVHARLGGLMLPKCDGAADVVALDLVVEDAELRGGLTPGALEIVPLPETARSKHQQYEVLTSSPRVHRGIINGAAPGGDYYRALGSEWTREGIETLYTNSRGVLNSRAAGLTQIICSPCTDVEDKELLREVMSRARTLGATSGMAIHPSQVSVINEVFTPSETQIEEARAIVDAMAAAVASGRGAVRHGAQMIDYAMARTSYDLLRRAEAMGCSVGHVPELQVPAN